MGSAGSGRWTEFVADEGGAVLRDYAIAVIVAAVLVIVTMTLMAETLYSVYLRVFGA